MNNCHEYVFHFTKTGKVKLDRLAIGVPYKDKSNIKRWNTGGKDKRCVGNIWFIPYKTIKNFKDRPHPATFPVELVKKCILLHGKTDVMLDPFLGIGSSALAAKECGVKKFIGFDIDPEYIATCLNRLS